MLRWTMIGVGAFYIFAVGVAFLYFVTVGMPWLYGALMRLSGWLGL